MPPAHEPKEKDRLQVIAWSGAGFTQEAMAYHLKIDPKTLREHYRDELDKGKELANSFVTGKLMALVSKGHFKAIQFWLQAQAKWTTKHEVDIKGKLSFSDFVAQCGDLDDPNNADD